MSDPIRAACRTDYLPAFHHSGRRRLEQVLWTVLHDEEAPTARSAAAYFRLEQAGGSAQLCVDAGVCYRCLSDDAIPWGASSAPALSANLHGVHIEQAGYARWVPKQWLLHRGTIDRAAFKTAQYARKYRLPLRFLVAADLIAGARRGHLPKGITTHAEISKASRVLDPAHAWSYTHSDPGRFWPRRRFMRRVAVYYAELG